MKNSLLYLLQIGLLAYRYSEPKGRIVSEVAYSILLSVSSLLLLALAYRSFQFRQPVVGVIATLLAFPGLLLITALAFLSKRI